MDRLSLPPDIAAGLASAAEDAGADPEQFATLLLDLALLLRDSSVETPFARTVREHLEARWIDPKILARVLSSVVDEQFWEKGEHAAEPYDPTYTIKPGFGVLMAKETPMYSYGTPAPAPQVRTSVSAMGRYAHLRSGSEAFARAKAAEIAREDRPRP